MPDDNLETNGTERAREAGQKAVNPPYKGVFEPIHVGVNTYAGGITWVDADYDERVVNALDEISGQATLPARIAQELRALYGSVRPAKSRKEMQRELEETGRLGKVSPRSFQRALEIAFSQGV